MAAWRYEISLLMLKKYFTRLPRSLVKYFSTLKEKFCISVWPCNILYLWSTSMCNLISRKVLHCTAVPLFYQDQTLQEALNCMVHKPCAFLGQQHCKTDWIFKDNFIKYYLYCVLYFFCLLTPRQGHAKYINDNPFHTKTPFDIITWPCWLSIKSNIFLAWNLALEWEKKVKQRVWGGERAALPTLPVWHSARFSHWLFFLLFYLIFKANEKGEEHSVSMHKVMPKQYVDFLG